MKNFRRLLAAILVMVLFANSAFAATFTVTSDLDTGDASPGDGNCDIGGVVCTLRAAIQEANTLAGTDTINFTAGSRNITPGSTMTVSSQVTIDGTTVGGGNTIVLDANDGAFAAFTLDGSSDGTTIKGAFYIKDFGDGAGVGTGIGINILPGADTIDIGSATVGEGLVFGLGTDGTTTTDNENDVGIRSAGTNVTIRENTISNSVFSGIELTTGAKDTTITRNCIGGSRDCDADKGNTLNGILVSGTVSMNGGNGGTEGLILGDASASANNIIGNNLHGVRIGDGTGTISGSYYIQGNNIGMNASGTAIGNTQHGIFVDNDADGANLYIGDDNDLTNIGSEINIIGSNGGDCINVLEGTSVVIAANTIGLNSSGVARGCTGSGIEIGDNDDYPTTVWIGSDNDSVTVNTAAQNNGEVNTISSNADGGIKILNAESVTIAGNKIGTDSDVTLNRGNTGFAIKVSAPFLTTLNIGYGGSNSSGQNYIGFTTNAGSNGAVTIEDTATAATVKIKGTFIGDYFGNIANALTGLYLSADANYTIGNDGDGTNETTESVIIARNAGNGIQIANGALTAIISDCRIGVVAASFFADYITAGANGTGGTVGSMNGIKVDSNTLTTLTLGSTRNLIGSNPEHGLLISNMATSGTVSIRKSYFGVGNDGTTDLGNGGDGINIGTGAGASGVTFNIGSTTASTGNLISGNTGDGIESSGTVAQTVNIYQNTIGLNAAGTAALLNGGSGIKLANSLATNVVGDGASTGRNVISGNSAYGMNITGGNVTVKGNYIGTNAAGTSSIPNTLGSIVATSTSGSISSLTIGGSNNIIDNTTNTGITYSGVSDTNETNSFIESHNDFIDTVGPFALTGASYYWWYRSATEYGPKQCRDGYDNDGDSNIDYPTDLGCSGLQDDQESGETIGNTGGVVIYVAPAATTATTRGVEEVANNADSQDNDQDAADGEENTEETEVAVVEEESERPEEVIEEPVVEEVSAPIEAQPAPTVEQKITKFVAQQRMTQAVSTTIDEVKGNERLNWDILIKDEASVDETEIVNIPAPQKTADQQFVSDVFNSIAGGEDVGEEQLAKVEVVVTAVVQQSVQESLDAKLASGQEASLNVRLPNGEYGKIDSNTEIVFTTNALKARDQQEVALPGQVIVTPSTVLGRGNTSAMHVMAEGGEIDNEFNDDMAFFGVPLSTKAKSLEEIVPKKTVVTNLLPGTEVGSKFMIYAAGPRVGEKLTAFAVDRVDPANPDSWNVYELGDFEVGEGNKVAIDADLTDQIKSDKKNIEVVIQNEDGTGSSYPVTVNTSKELRLDTVRMSGDETAMVDLRDENKSLTENLYSSVLLASVKDAVKEENGEEKTGPKMLSGYAEPGTVIYVTWESVVMNSVVVADASQGYFEVEVPEDIVKGDHTAVAYSYNKKKKVASNFTSILFSKFL